MTTRTWHIYWSQEASRGDIKKMGEKMEENIAFENAQELKSKHSRKFMIPEQQELERLKPGDSVKLMAFDLSFWAIITEVKEGIITGRVDTKLKSPNLKYNRLISFKLENIFGIVTQEELTKALSSRRTQLGDNTAVKRWNEIFSDEELKEKEKGSTTSKSAFIIDITSASDKNCCNQDGLEEANRYLDQMNKTNNAESNEMKSNQDKKKNAPKPSKK